MRFFLVVLQRISQKKLIFMICADHFGHIVTRVDFIQRVIKQEKNVFIITRMKLDAPLVRALRSDTTAIEVCRVRNFIGSGLLSVLIYNVLCFIGIALNRINFVADLHMIYKFNVNEVPQPFAYNEAEGAIKVYNSNLFHSHSLRFFKNTDISLSNDETNTALSLIRLALGNDDLRFDEIVFVKTRSLHYRKSYQVDVRRNSFADGCYSSLIEEALAAGRVVVYDDSVIRGFWQGSVGLGVFGVYEALIRTVLFFKSRFVIQPHSGPLHLCNIVGTPSLVIDFYPFWQGSWLPSDIVVPQQVYHTKENRYLSYRELVSNFQELFFGAPQHDIQFRPSSLEYAQSAFREIDLGDDYIPMHFSSLVELTAARDEFRAHLPRGSVSASGFNKYPEHLIYDFLEEKK